MKSEKEMVCGINVNEDVTGISERIRPDILLDYIIIIY